MTQELLILVLAIGLFIYQARAVHRFPSKKHEEGYEWRYKTLKVLLVVQAAAVAYFAYAYV